MRTARMLVMTGAVLLCLSAQAGATTMIYLPLEELYQMSDVVVRGTVQSHTSFWGERGEMFTDWTVSVDEVLHGEPVEQVVVRQMGGEIGDRRAMIPGDARFHDGEHVVLFLVFEDGVHYLTALGQAKLTVSVHQDRPTELPVQGGSLELPRGSAAEVHPIDATLVRALSDIAFYQPEEGELFELSDEVLTLEQLRAMSPSAAAPANEGGAE